MRVKQNDKVCIKHLAECLTHGKNLCMLQKFSWVFSMEPHSSPREEDFVAILKIMKPVWGTLLLLSLRLPLLPGSKT